jgi:fido (protein-threonine AMPylation protein)
MHPLDCPEWEYKDHPNHVAILKRSVSEVLVGLAQGTVDTLSVAVDTRDSHRQTFRELTPHEHDYFAGHYRGENFRCLRYYSVGIQGDPRVGAVPASVDFRMNELNDHIRSGILALDANLSLTPKERLRYVLALACHAFVAFLTVHPYANGNGHAGRLIVWSILGRYGHWPRRWPVEPRPPDPPYSELIVRHRNGDVEPLERYLLQALIS